MPAYDFPVSPKRLGGADPVLVHVDDDTDAAVRSYLEGLASSPQDVTGVAGQQMVWCAEVEDDNVEGTAYVVSQAVGRKIQTGSFAA